jgi:uncharacterized protein YggL (DUF469 family)
VAVPGVFPLSSRASTPWLGFRIVFQLDPKLSVPEQDEVHWSFILQAIEANGLFCHGGGRVCGFANAEYPVSATEEQRQAVTDWLRGHPAVVQFEVVTGRFKTSHLWALQNQPG